MFHQKNIELLIEGAKEYGISLSDEQINKFSRYAQLIVEWNEKMNLTAITDQKDIVIKHFLDSLSMSTLVSENDKSLIDVGTGAGFPGIPIKIIRKDIKVTLLDSLEKRIKFLKEVCVYLDLDNITQMHGRAEDFGANNIYREQYDIATARAVANLSVLLEYCLPLVKIGGIFVAMKGPDVNDEVKDAKKALDILGGKVEQIKSFILPNSDNERTLVVIRKYRQTPTNYPRKSGKPARQPIK